MSASASKPPTKSTTRGSSHKRKRSDEVDTPRKKLPQSVDSITEEVVRDVQKEAGDGSDPGTSIISTLPSQVQPTISAGDAQSRDGVEPDPPLSTEASIMATETRAVTLFHSASNVQVSNSNITAIGGDATIIQSCDGQFTEVQRNLICDHIAALAALPDISHHLKKHVLTQLVILLPRAEAVFNDYQTKKKSGPCFEGTRVALLREMANWITGQDESRMYILSGLAGIGKSTVAYTIASRAANPKLNLLGASFFFSRDEADRNNAKKLFTTIAYQLCVYSETFAKAIGDALLTESGSAAITKDPREQLQVLILDPLRSIVQSRARPILIVVDALDECCEDDIRAVVEGLSQLVRDLPSFKVILTTRPLPFLDYFLVSQDGHKLFRLQDIEDKVVDSDIRLYLRYNLSLEKVQEHFPRRQWHASDEQIDALVRAAGRLFIIASTAERYILDKFASNPAAQMQKLLRACAQDITPFKDLDHFYTVILRNVVPANCDNDDIVSRYQSVVGAIIFIQRPLPVSTLARLINIDVEEIRVVLEKLQSVILLGDNDVPRIYHKSFPDYLTEQARCKDTCLQINPRIGHTRIATYCFEITNSYLKYNILGLGDPARFMNNEDGLDKDGITDVQLQEKIPQQLHYACVYWSNHLEAANIEDPDLMNGLEKFVDEHTLHWFEVLSLIGNLDLAHRAFRVVLKLLKSTSSDLRQFLSDALRFLSKFYTVINRSALHTYHSALPFTPTGSLLYRRYLKEARHNICSVEGGPEKWNALVAHLDQEEYINSIKFSFDSTLFASCSEGDANDGTQGKLKIWDAASGAPISTIPGHRFAVSNDFSTVASSSDKIITYYNVNGSARSTAFITSSTVEGLALSDSSRVAAALSDGTVWLWNNRNAELIGSFDGFESDNWCIPWLLQFSTTGARLAYPSANGVVKLRDGVSGRFIADLRLQSGSECGPEGGSESGSGGSEGGSESGSEWTINTFTFSDDGSRIASVANDQKLEDRGLALWNTESGGLVGAIRLRVRNMDCRLQLAISANGSLLVTADLHDVTLWSENCGYLAKTKVLDDTAGMSMAFSLDNILAIETDDGIKLYNTNTHSLVYTFQFSTHSFSAPVAFSPDCTRLAYGDMNTVDLWDIRSIDNSSSLPQEAIKVTAMALSRDCLKLACGFMDGTVELWETSPTKRQSTFHQGSLVLTVGFVPDGRLYASGSKDGTIKLWNGRDASLHGTLKVPHDLREVALSNGVLVTAGQGATLWSLDTLSLIYTFNNLNDTLVVSISDEGDLAAFGRRSPNIIYLVDVMNCTIISEFAISDWIRKLTFLPNKSQLVAQDTNGDILSLNLNNNCITNEPTLEHLIQLPNTPLWHGVPVWLCRADGQDHVVALFSQHSTPIPVLRIPGDIPLYKRTQGLSMIAFSDYGGRIILLRLPTSHDA